MLLTITSDSHPATDLGWLLHKHPDRVQAFELPFGSAHVFYPEADEQRCTAALLLEVDPVGLVRRRRGPAGEGFLLQQYVNDRPYVASSLMSVAIARVFGSALSGRCEPRPELVDRRLALTATLSAVPARGGAAMLQALFEPLGYSVESTQHVLDPNFADWGPSPYHTLTLRAECCLRDLLTHLYVLIPVLDDEKHYWVGDEEVDKLLRKGEGWLASHPEKELIVRRYLRHQSSLTRSALAQLVHDEEPALAETEDRRAAEEDAIEQPIRLNDLRMQAVFAAVKESGAKSVVDLGCGEGRLLRLLLRDPSIVRLVGMDVSYRMLDIAGSRLKLENLPAAIRERVQLIHGSLVYRDARLSGFDAATVVEVIEHLDPPRLAAFERVVFEFARPKTVIVTTPNAEYNVRFETLPAGRFRHRDHRFEWTRAEFEAWARRIAERFGYEPRFIPVGPEDPAVGAATQMGWFQQKGTAA